MTDTRKLLRLGSRAPTPAQTLQRAVSSVSGVVFFLENVELDFDPSEIEPELIDKFVADMKEQISAIETALKRMSA